ncbi:hypothetical protein TNCV_2676461 [Trichonephila clavipes]|nr:hypothetical protein TNCV_2676461 [Trichonephila clavipes]
MCALTVRDVMHTVTDAKMLCLEIYRTLQIIATFEILRKIFLFISLKRKPGFEPGTSQTAVECSTNELYPRVSEPLLSIGMDTKMLCLEICRTGQIIPAFEILKIISVHFPEEGGTLV